MQPASIQRIAAVTLALGAIACGSTAPPNTTVAAATWPQQLAAEFRSQPDTVFTRWLGLIGEYGADSSLRWIALEREQRMWILDQRGNYVPLAERSDSVFDAPLVTAAVAGEVRFHRAPTGRAIAVQVSDIVLERHNVEPPPGVTQLRITPLRPIDELRREALAAKPPAESGTVKAPDLVELTKLDSTIKLEVRYASDNNFLGTRLYDEGSAFLQRSAADALVKAHRALGALGYGLLVHDGYRPWYVTKIFWDATPDSVKWLVANPAEGSKHNRGAAVDVTLFDRATGKAVEMPSTYDEVTRRAQANYPGGTALHRWHRALLKRALEHEGFTANPKEWWHFDYKDWKSYPILNLPFDQVRTGVPVK